MKNLGALILIVLTLLPVIFGAGVRKPLLSTV
jgi:hypothetical protein